MVKVIETMYNGYRFRSRNEARWAVFFDNIKLKYRYELEGFDLNGIWYLPDFYFPQQKCWVEVKPDLPSKDEREKAIRLCISKKESVFILAGDVWKDALCFCFNPIIPHITKETIINYYEKMECKIHLLSMVECISQDTRGNLFGFDLERGFRWSSAYWGECKECKTLGLLSLVAPSAFIHEDNLCECRKLTLYPQRIEEAFEIARQSRF